MSGFKPVRLSELPEVPWEDQWRPCPPRRKGEEADIEAIKERCRRATKGVWKYYPEPRSDGERGGQKWCIEYAGGGNQDYGGLFVQTHGGSLDDFIFIAHARRDIPLLLEKVERLEAEKNA